MKKHELFQQAAEAVHKLVTPTVNEIFETIESYLNPVYCPTCGSCGETGCCSPDRCKEVICQYGETNLKDYKDLLDENEQLRNQLKSIDDIIKTIQL